MFEITKEIIVQQTEELFTTAVNKYAKRLKTEPQSVQFVLGLNPDDSVVYTLLENYKPKQNLELKDITGLAMYFALKSEVPAQISAAIFRFAEETGASPSDVTIMILCDENEKLHYCIYKQTEFIRETNLDETIKIE